MAEKREVFRASHPLSPFLISRPVVDFLASCGGGDVPWGQAEAAARGWTLAGTADLALALAALGALGSFLDSVFGGLF